MSFYEAFYIVVLINFVIGVLFTTISLATSSEGLKYKDIPLILIGGQLGITMVLIVVLNIDIE